MNLSTTVLDSENCFPDLRLADEGWVRLGVRWPVPTIRDLWTIRYPAGGTRPLPDPGCSLADQGDLTASLRPIGSLQFIAHTFDVRWKRQVVEAASLEHPVHDLAEHQKPPLILIRFR